MEKLIKKCEGKFNFNYKNGRNTFNFKGDILIVTHQAPLAAIQELLLDDSNPKFPGTATVSKVLIELFLLKPINFFSMLKDRMHLARLT